MQRRPTHQRPFTMVSTAGLAAVAAITGAIALWLHQSSQLATTGQRIFELDAERQALLERRATALVAHAAATDPRRLEARAQALGLRPAEFAEPLVLAPDPDAPSPSLVAADSPLAITGAKVPVAAVRATFTERLLSASLSAASASEREVPAGTGGSR